VPMVNVLLSDGTAMVIMTVVTILMRLTVPHQLVHLESFSVVAMLLAVYQRRGFVMVTLTVMIRVMKGVAHRHQAAIRPVQTLNSCVLITNVSTRAGSVMVK